MKYVKDKEVAEDIVQDVITELYSRRLLFDTPVALKSFLFLSVKNKALNFLRRQQAQERYLNNRMEEESFFLNNIIREEVYYHLQKMIGELSDPVRQIYELTLQELSNEEIAEQLGLSVDSVKAHKKRGKQILKERLKGLMAFCRAIRKLIYTTNTVEGYHRQIRKVTKNKGVFPSDTALEKLVYLAYRNIRKKWTMPLANWATISQQLAIKFGERFKLL
ncbi:sigma-70 family RNA polymerase sigma factor [Butyricimonas virosa]|nr:sigma-70 family RNA polymerase sigma factor [Butyricimonas virosa]UWO49455.1 sigma-70 family RNA polymerase sigma factor [Butyricimonas virosa]